MPATDARCSYIQFQTVSPVGTDSAPEYLAHRCDPHELRSREFHGRIQQAGQRRESLSLLLGAAEAALPMLLCQRFFSGGETIPTSLTGKDEQRSRMFQVHGISDPQKQVTHLSSVPA